MRRTRFLLAAFLAAGCLPPPRPAAPPAAPPPAVELVPPEAWPALADDLDAASFERAAERSRAYLETQQDKLWTVGPAQVGTQALVDTLDALVAVRRSTSDPAALTAALKAGFELYRVRGSTSGPGAFFSAYYQPTLDASRSPTPEYRYPIYARPPDLVDIDLGAFDPKWKGEHIFGRAASSGTFVPYFSRHDIDVRGELAGKGLELAWLRDDFDRLDLHIEGSAILRFPDGTQALAHYAASNGLPYASVGLAVAGSGAMTRAELTHATLKAYLQAHPEGASWLLARDPRYTFFELRDLPPDGEPDGFIDQPLTAGRSIAVDPRAEPLGAVCWAAVPTPQADAQGRLLARSTERRFLFPQDIGGAIKGPGRVDLYLGHGADAEAAARRVWDAGELYILVKKRPMRTR